MFKKALVFVVLIGGLMIGTQETPNDSFELVNSAAAAVPVPGVFALLGIGGLAMFFGLKRKK